MPPASLQQPTANRKQPRAAKPLRGCVITSYRTYKGKKLGPYFFRKWKVGRKVYKQYIKPADVEKIRAACQHSKERRKEINRFLDNADFLRKMCERYDRGKVATPEQEAYIMRLHHEGHYIAGPRPPLRPRRVFGAPIFSKFLDFLPSRKVLAEITRTQGPAAIWKVLADAKYAYYTKIFDEAIAEMPNTQVPPHEKQKASPALAWMTTGS